MNRKLAWCLLGLCTLLALLSFGYPMYVIRPFKAQGASELALALVVKRWGPYVAILAAIAGIAAATQLWRNANWLSRSLTGLLAALLVAFTGLAHWNVYERMFHPIPKVDILPGSQASLEADDMVLAVKVGGMARAYPIRMLGYHHIVNDWVGGVPLAGTY